MPVRTLQSLTLDQWMEEFQKLSESVRRQLFLRIDDNYFSLSTTTTF